MPASANKLLWLNGGIAQSLAPGDSVDAAGIWTFSDVSGATKIYNNLDVSGITTFTGNLTIGGYTTFNNDVTVNGDLNVDGNIVSRGQVDVVIQDSFLDLNMGNTTTSPPPVDSLSK